MPMPMSFHSRLAVTAAFLACAPSGSAAQEIQPPASGRMLARVAISSVYDDNVYRTEEPTADFIWRVTPELMFRQRSPRATLLASYNFDAERFVRNNALSDSLARQAAALSLATRPSATSNFAVDAGYLSTSTAADLNVSSRLTGARLPASEWHAGAQFNHTLGAKGGLATTYMFTQRLYSPGDEAVQSAELRLTRRFNARYQGHVRVEIRRFQFEAAPALSSEIAVAGWESALTPTISLSLEGGPRYTSGSLRPELSAVVRKKSGLREMSASYTVTQTTALGLSGIVNTQRVQAELAYRPPAAFQFAVRGAGLLNSNQNSSSRGYGISATVARPVKRAVWIELGYAGDVQREGSGIFAVFGNVRHNAFSARLVVTSL